MHRTTWAPHALLLSLTLAACTSPGASTATPPMTPLPATLAVGQSLGLPDRSTLRYVGTRDDSRCPPDVTCIRAGDATADFDHAAPGAAATRISVVVPDAPTARVGAWRLTVDALAHGDAPTVTVTVSPP